MSLRQDLWSAAEMFVCPTRSLLEIFKNDLTCLINILLAYHQIDLTNLMVLISFNFVLSVFQYHKTSSLIQINLTYKME